MNRHFSSIALTAAWLLAGAALGQSTNFDSLAAVLPKLPDGEEKGEVLGQLLKLSANTDLEKARDFGRQRVAMSRRTGDKLGLATANKDIGVTFLIASEYDSAKRYDQLARRGFEELLERPGAADRAKVLEGYAGTLGNIGNWHYYQSALDSAVHYLRRAVDLSGQSGIEKVKANSLGTLAFIYTDQAKPDEAVAMQFEALKTFEKLGNLDGIARSYQGIGQVYCRNLHQCQLALDYYRKALAIKVRTGNERGMAHSYSLLGYAHDELSAFDSAEHYYRKSAELAEKLGDKRLLLDGYSALAEVWDKTGRPESDRIEMNLKAIRLAKEIGRTDGLYVSYHNLAMIHSARGEEQKVVEYLKLAIPLAAEKEDWHMLEVMNSSLYKTYRERLHDTPAALAALEAYLVAHDSVASMERFQAASDITARYETEKKEATIAQQEEAIRQGHRRVWLVSGILALAVAVGFALFRLTRTLRKRNAEKELLIKEIHHRVKNNLQVLSSLLHLQGRQIHDEAALDAVREGQNRVDAMSLIHQKLYTGDRLTAIEMPQYLRELADTLLDSFGAEGRVAIDVKAEPIALDVDTAIPLGLIVNELATNSLKYAFPGGRPGRVEIALFSDERNSLVLEVSDDGAGRVGAGISKGGTGFGSRLVDMLSKKLKGRVEQPEREAGFATRVVMER